MKYTYALISQYQDNYENVLDRYASDGYKVVCSTVIWRNDQEITYLVLEKKR